MVRAPRFVCLQVHPMALDARREQRWVELLYRAERRNDTIPGHFRVRGRQSSLIDFAQGPAKELSQNR